jgi:hypothetical protein
MKTMHRQAHPHQPTQSVAAKPLFSQTLVARSLLATVLEWMRLRNSSREQLSGPQDLSTVVQQEQTPL